MDAESRNPSKRQYKNKFSAEYPQSEAEGISNRSVNKKAVHSLQRMHGFGKSCFI